MDQWTEVRRRVLIGALSKRAACREYDLSWHTLAKMLKNEEPPGYRLAQPRRKPMLEHFLPILHEILESDKQAPKKQRHTATRIFHRLRDEHGYGGSYTTVRTAVRQWKLKTQEVFLPLSHPPGEAQVDFGFAEVDLVGLRQQVALFLMTLPYSDAFLCRLFHASVPNRFKKDINGPLSFLVACQRGSATTTPRLPWPRSPVVVIASQRAGFCVYRVIFCTNLTSALSVERTKKGLSRTWWATGEGTF